MQQAIIRILVVAALATFFVIPTTAAQTQSARSAAYHSCPPVC